MTALRDARVDLLEVPFRTPLVSSAHRWDGRRVALVRLIAGDGLEGIGEVAAAEPGGLTESIPDRLVADLANLDPADPVAFHGLLRGIDRWPGIGRAVRSAVETAAADLLARAGGRSIAASQASHPRTRITVNGLVGIGTPEAAAREAMQLVAAGFGCVKLKGGSEPRDRLVERAAAVRAAIGPTVRLRLDLNGAWHDESEAAAALRALASLDLEYVEQPLAPERGPAALARLRRAAPVPLAADESVDGPEAALALLETEAVDVLVVKPARVGGLLQARRIVELAAAFGVPIVVSTLFETGIGLAAALQLAAALPGEERAHGLATADLLASDLLAEPLSISAGGMAVPPGTGIGVRLDPAAVEAFRIQ